MPNNANEKTVTGPARNSGSSAAALVAVQGRELPEEYCSADLSQLALKGKQIFVEQEIAAAKDSPERLIAEALGEIDFEQMPTVTLESIPIPSLSGQVLVYCPEYLVESLGILLKEEVHTERDQQRVFVCSADLEKAFSEMNIALIITQQDSATRRDIQEFLASNNLQVPITYVADLDLIRPESMISVLEQVTMFKALKDIQRDKPHNLELNASAIELFLAKDIRYLDDVFSTLADNQNRAIAFANFPGCVSNHSRRALELLYGPNIKNSETDARSGFGTAYSMQDLKNELQVPGARLYTATYQGFLLGYLIANVNENTFSERALALKQALAAYGQLPPGKLGYIKMLHITPMGELFAKVYGEDLSDLVLTGVLAEGQAAHIENFIFETRQHPFPNRVAINAHASRGATFSDIYLLKNSPDNERFPVNLARIGLINPTAGLHRLNFRAEAQIARGESHNAALEENIRTRLADRRKELFRAANDQRWQRLTIEEACSEENLQAMSAADFTLLVNALQTICFNVEEQSDYVLDSGNDRYFSYTAEYYARQGLIDPKLVSDLRRGKTLLDVGAGSAHLDRLLVYGLDVPKESITLNDIAVSSRLGSLTENLVTFDMNSQWPKKIGKFDYILFGQSLWAGLGEWQSRISQRFESDQEDVVEAFMNHRLADLPLWKRTFFLDLIDMDVPIAKQAFEILHQAVTFLKPGGEIRVQGHILTDASLTYLALRLREMEGISIQFGEHEIIKIAAQ